MAAAAQQRDQDINAFTVEVEAAYQGYDHAAEEAAAAKIAREAAQGHAGAKKMAQPKAHYEV